MPGSAGFEMRRLEMLSNTIFGVAMTLLAYDLPRGRLPSTAPDWATIWHTYDSHLIALCLSFIVAGTYWISYQRRLAHAPHANRLMVFGNLFFLLLIVLLPVTTGLYGSYGNRGSIVLLYACHLVAIAFVNTTLWWFAATPHRDWSSFFGAAFALGSSLLAAILAIFEPRAAWVFWVLAFGGSVVTWLAERRCAKPVT